MFFPVLDTYSPPPPPHPRSSSPRQVSQTQPVIFNKCLKLTDVFLSWRILKWLSNGWLQRLSGEALGWGNGAGRRSWPPRRLQAVGIHTGPATKMSLWLVLAALWLYTNTLSLTHTHTNGKAWLEVADEHVERMMGAFGNRGWKWRVGVLQIHSYFSPSLYEQAKPHWVNQCSS